MTRSSGLLGDGSSGYKPLPLKCGQRTGLPLVPCPKCGEEILELVAAPGSKVPGSIFFKCRLHDRDDPSSCSWYLFADKYERLLIRSGLIEGTREVSAQEVPVLPDELGGLQVDEQDVEALKTRIDGLDAKLKKLVDLGQIGLVCCVVVAVFVVIGVIRMLVKYD